MFCFHSNFRLRHTSFLSLKATIDKAFMWYKLWQISNIFYLRSAKFLEINCLSKCLALPCIPIRHFYFAAAKAVCPHPSKIEKGGEDASFYNWRCLAVADGVGGWESSGIDSGKYSKELIMKIQNALEEHVSINKNTSLLPLSILKEAYNKTKAIGSTTCCLVLLDVKSRIIRAANLGDSGFIVIRPDEGEIVCKSEFQCHDFNCPLQLGTGSSDLPEHAELLDFPVKENDWIVVATDGLWDNLYDEQILKIIRNSSTPEAASKLLLTMAIQYSRDQHWRSPFAEKESMYGNYSQDVLVGGKPDDISIIVATIKDPWNCKRSDVPTEVAEYYNIDEKREIKKALQIVKIKGAKMQRKMHQTRLRDLMK